MPVRRGTLSALPTLDSCPHLELLAQLLTRALLTTAPEACLEQPTGYEGPSQWTLPTTIHSAGFIKLRGSVASVWDKPAQPRFQREPRDECIHLGTGQPSAGVSGILEAARPRRPPPPPDTHTHRDLAFLNPPSFTSALGPAS